MHLTDKEYEALLLLFHEYNAAFNELPFYMKDMFYRRLSQTNQKEYVKCN